MLGRLRDSFHDWFYRPRLDWIQVEINRECNARCIYCPSAGTNTNWPEQRMPIETFEKILPTLAKSAQHSHWHAPMIHLQGWGEPLLHPDFFAMVEMTRRAGCTVGTTTNATLVGEATATRLVESGIDLVSFSLAGIDENNDRIRRGTSMKRVLDAIDTVNRIKHERASATPSIHIAYMLLKSGIENIERIPDVFAGRGIEQIVVSTLFVVPDSSIGDETVLPANDQEFQTLERRLARVAETAKTHGIELHYRIPRPNRSGSLCAEDVSRTIVVTVDGEVTPCMLNRFHAENDPRPNPNPFRFGNLAQRSLAGIWWSDEYLRFRRSFWDANPPPRCLACQKLG
ncbi:MAG: radical SAM protein [Alphaproteobacteria bacterium]|nr:radical SAM protein [Alphaproteobacteria bacterium]